ncbi:hypothetical protein FHS18_003115 [Paenibacillus phyllosphaerae]|uniref:Uncharacterized protein n=1 Tax=Paenibacillus phyllosphaerae TaxID=274593 RepID=A0A7W5AYQ5_9BACL|nr:hypothetical protein [Paenibacillus phyllosphaerae]MBB3111047.1 hypothetical protein [Paenibacillus phyllosphaerae]
MISALVCVHNHEIEYASLSGEVVEERSAGATYSLTDDRQLGRMEVGIPY